MAYNEMINNLIPADDLHWCEEERKYVSLSGEEINEIILHCVERGIEDLDDIHRVIKWCGTVRVGQLLWKNFLLDSIEIVGFDKNGEPRFAPNRKKKDEY